ncbi:MAG TPA: hypothetical protein VF889_08540 [Bacteroidota bacterium]
MDIEPASIDQLRRVADGGWVTVDADIGGVAADIKRLDPCLNLRYSESAGCFVVYRVHRNGEPCRRDDPERTEELVLTAQECDQRIVKRLEFIDPHGRGGYDYAQAVERAVLEAKENSRKEFRERLGDVAEQTAHALRKDLGERYKGRAFIPRDLP